MNKEVVIIMAEDDAGHANLIKKNLKRAGITNEIIHFEDGHYVLDFLKCEGDGPHRVKDTAYLLLLDIRMPQMDGVEVLKEIKKDSELKKMPVIMITTTDDPKEVEECHLIGCSSYITKPIDYDNFVDAIKNLGLFLSIVQVPELKGDI